MRIDHALSPPIQPEKEVLMISERDMVVLTNDLSQHGLQKGDVGLPPSLFVPRSAMEPNLFRAAEDAVARRDDATAYALLVTTILAGSPFA
jgi:hypothetical protein